MLIPVPNPSASRDLLLVGLGNPGSEYTRTRHNLGSACLNEYARRVGIELSRRRWRSRVGCGEVAGRRLWLLEPQTFMNLSGRAVAEAVRDVGVGPEDVWVVHDEMDLPLCRLRIKIGGSSAGNGGVESIIGALHSDAFVRFRVGVGKPARKGSRAGVGHVLGRFSPREAEQVAKVVDGVASALEMAVTAGLAPAMNLYNRAGSLGCEELP
jgi:PTH1 family peptidyl-tRNA hydrolase